MLRLTSEGKLLKREFRTKIRNIVADSKKKLQDALALQAQAKLQAPAKTSEEQKIAVNLAIMVKQLVGEIELWERELIPELDND